MFNPFEELSAQLQEIRTLLSNGGVHTAVMQAIEQPITQEELCEFLRISETTVIRLKKQKKIPFLEIGGSIRYDKAAVIKAFEKNKSKT